MTKEIVQILTPFRSCFNRRAAFGWFMIIVFGLIVRSDTHGVSSIIRCFAFAPGDYYSLLHFFKASSWQMERITSMWISIVCKQCSAFIISDLILLVGDGIKVAKEAKYMPGVKKLKQQSGNSKKPPYIFGHHFGVVALLTGTVNKLFALPLIAELHEGVEELRDFQGKKPPTINGEKKVSLVTLMIDNAAFVAKRIEKPSVIVLDAFYAVGPTFLMARECMSQNGRRLLHVITRAKKNAVAYSDPPEIQKEKRGRGRPRKYGDKHKLYDLFRTRSQDFKTSEVEIYGKTKTVSYLCLDLIWRPIKDKLRFVFVKDGSRKIILICSSFELTPQEIIMAYSYRFKIEVAFNWLKNLIGGFCYHFWNRALQELNTSILEMDLKNITDKKLQKLIADSVNAIEGFVNFSCISLGVLQILSIKYHERIWKKYTGWLRTKSNDIPSEEVVMSVVRCDYYNNFSPFSDDAISQIINKRRRRCLHLYEEVERDKAINF